jgi:hypothetical protein
MYEYSIRRMRAQDWVKYLQTKVYDVHLGYDVHATDDIRREHEPAPA